MIKMRDVATTKGQYHMLENQFPAKMKCEWINVLALTCCFNMDSLSPAYSRTPDEGPA